MLNTIAAVIVGVGCFVIIGFSLIGMVVSAYVLREVKMQMKQMKKKEKEDLEV